MEAINNNSEHSEVLQATDNKREQYLTSAAIRLCLELESLFKLYSYRLTAPEQFREILNQTVKNYQHEIQ